MKSGFRIGAPAAEIPAEMIERFAVLPTAVISDSMNRLSGGGSTLRPIGLARICAPAVTVRTAPGDNLLVHKALDLAREGEVIVVDAGGDLTNAIIGERMLMLAEHRGLAGFIINGAVRDAAVLRTSELTVFAAGVTHRGPYKNGPGEINYPIAIDGMVINAGDLVVADEDGIVAIPVGDLATVCIDAERKARQENENDPRTESREWIDERLRKAGCEILEASPQKVKLVQ